MAKVRLVITAEESLMEIFMNLAVNLGEDQALAALAADREVTASLLEKYLLAPVGAFKRGERVYWKQCLSRRLRTLDAIEVAVKAAEIDEEDEPAPGPWLCWVNPAAPAAAYRAGMAIEDDDLAF
jgi:hypothetical protein